jgi:hypothetical protein
MRCKLIVVLDVLIDIYIYVTPFVYAYSDQTSMLGCVWDVCIRLSNLWYA